MKASEDSLFSNWVTIKKGPFTASFPHHPIFMQFDISLKDTDQLGHLEVYSAPLHKGVCMLSVFSSPLLTVDQLEPTEFKKLFYSMVVQRMFYTPQVFKNNQAFDFSDTSWEGLPALDFSFLYEDKSVNQILQGRAILHKQTLYILFYLNAEEAFQEEMAQHFIENFTIDNI